MIHIIAFWVLAITSLDAVNGQCAMPPSLYPDDTKWMYLSRIESLLTGEEASYFEQFTPTNRYEFSALQAGIDAGNPNFVFEFNDTCENYGDYKNNDFTVASMLSGESDIKRLCIEAYAVDNILLYRQTNAVVQASTYTIDQCKSLIESRNSWSLEIKYPFSTSDPPSRMALPNHGLRDGLYRLRYYQDQVANEPIVKTCDVELSNDLNSSTAVVDKNVLKIQSCNKTNTYEFPVYTDLKIIGVVTNLQVDPSGLGFDPPTGGFVGLANVIKDDNGNDVTYYYCGQYKFRPKRFTIELPTLYPSSPECYSNDQAYGENIDTSTPDITLELTTLECESNPCINGGTCQQWFFYYACDCPHLYIGDHCETNVCEPNPCEHGGSCMAYANSVTNCTCPIGVSGSLCEHRTACADFPCENGGTCYPTNDPQISDGYWCNCPEYYGLQPNCSVKDSCQDPATSCKHGGTCSMDKTYVAHCICDDEWTGTTCEIRVGSPCTPDPCKNGGTCSKTSADSFQCQCTSNYIGDNCVTPKDDCAQQPCINGGVCSINPTTNTFVCDCPSAYTGVICQRSATLSNPCASGSNPCMHGGICGVNKVSGSPFCMCPNTHTGSVCETPITCIANNPCHNMGTCLRHPVTDAVVCNCLRKYTGDLCQTEMPVPCFPNPCANGGTCLSNKDGDTYCVCPTTHVGQECKEPSPPSVCNTPDGKSPCKNGGVCYPTNAASSGFICRCINDYTGDLCQTPPVNPCDPASSGPLCMHGGTCVPIPGLSSEYFCQCTSDYTGGRCETPIIKPNVPCFPNPCANGGTCLSNKDGDTYCVCPTTHVGPECKEPSPPSVCNPPDGKSPCKNGGVCYLTNAASFGFICKCINDYTGDLCQTPPVNPCDRASSGVLCMNGGTCVPHPASSSGYFCQCTSDYTGGRCENPNGTTTTSSGECKDQMNCQNGGTCYFDGVKYGCRCGGYWAGLTCEVWSDWFIAVVVLVAILALLFLTLLVLCMCYCCCGWTVGDNTHAPTSATGRYSTSVHSNNRPPSNAPSSVNFKVKPPNPMYGIHIMHPN